MGKYANELKRENTVKKLSSDDGSILFPIALTQGVNSKELIKLKKL